MGKRGLGDMCELSYVLIPDAEPNKKYIGNFSLP